MEKVIRWVYGFSKKNYKCPEYLVLCLDDREPLENDGYWSAIRVLNFDTEEKALNWISFNVAEADRDRYVIYKLNSNELN